MSRPMNVTFGDDAKKALIKGVNTLADAVTITLGASGKTVIMEDGYKRASVTKDGVSVARSIILEDNLENVGCTIIKESAEKTVGNCGDGTTTTILLAQALINEGDEVVRNNEYNAFEVKRGVEEAAAVADALLLEKSIPVTETTLFNVATISANNDAELGSLIANTFINAGDNGVVHIEQSPTAETYTTSVEGLEVQRGFTNRYFITDDQKEITVLDNPLVLLVDTKVDNMEQIRPYLEYALEKSRSILIVGDVDDRVQATLVLNKVKGGMPLCHIKPPHFGEKRTAHMQDLAVVTGGIVIDDSVGDNFQNIDWKFLGEADKIVVDKAYTKIIASADSTERTERQIDMLKSLREEQSADQDKEFIDERIANLAGKVEIIYVGGQTDVERDERKDRVDDAVNATKASIEKGISAGGGISLFDISFLDLIEIKHNPSFNAGVILLKNALKRPVSKILENSVSKEEVIEIKSNIVNNGIHGYGYDVKHHTYGNMIEMGVIDPTKVIQHSLRNAVSVAMTFLTTGCTVTNIK